MCDQGDANATAGPPVQNNAAANQNALRDIVNAAVSSAMKDSMVKLQPLIDKIQVAQDRVMSLVDESTSQAMDGRAAPCRPHQPSELQMSSIPVSRIGQVPLQRSPASGESLSPNSFRDQASFIVEAIRSVHLPHARASVRMPTFDSTRDTAEFYIHELEVYFKSMGHDESQFLYLVGSVITKDLKVWFNHASSTGAFSSWGEFKELFIARYDGLFEAENRRRHLTNKRQGFHEPVEKYIYEVMRLSKICYPQEPVVASVQRAKMGLYPRLLVALGAAKFSTPDSLYDACKDAHFSLTEQDKLYNLPSALPPLVTAPNDPYRPGKSQRGRKNNFRKRNSPAPASDDNAAPDQNAQSQGNSQSNYGATLTVPNQENYGHQQRTYQRGGRSGNKSRSRSPRGSGDYNQDTRESTKCFKCHGYGHVQRFCPNRVGMALYACQSTGHESHLNPNGDPNPASDHLNQYGNSMKSLQHTPSQ